MPQREGVFILDTVASDVAVGRQLSQVQGDKIRPIAFACKRLTASQGKYCTTCKELLALITFTCQFRHYLLGRRFLLRTDHSSLAWLMRFKDIEGQLARWLEELAQFDMQIVHTKGKEHANADALSRLPDDILRCNCRAGSEVASLPCGGCKYCSRACQQWARFEDDVNDVVSLAVVLPKATSEYAPRISKCKKDHDSNWASIIIPNKRGEEQKKDPDLKVIYGRIQEKKVPTTKELASLSPTIKALWTNRSLPNVSDDILWYTWKEGEDKKLLVVPECMKKALLKLAHDNIMSGHLGIAKTKERIKRHFFWPNLAADVENCEENIKPQ